MGMNVQMDIQMDVQMDVKIDIQMDKELISGSYPLVLDMSGYVRISEHILRVQVRRWGQLRPD